MKRNYDYCEHIERIMKEKGSSPLTFVFKRRVLEEMDERTNEVSKRGLSDEKVLHDLIIDEFGEKKVLSDYEKYLQEIKEKKQLKAAPIVCAAVMLLSVAVYLIIGFTSDFWHPTWLIIEGAATAVFIGLMLFGVSLLHRHHFLYFLLRLLVAGSVMVLSQFVFLVLRIPFGIENAYLVFLGALGLMFVTDFILAAATKQRLLILNAIVTVPVLAAFVYVILGLLHVISWWPWRFIFLGAVFCDLLIILGVLAHNKKYSYKPEVEDSWKEN